MKKAIQRALLFVTALITVGGISLGMVGAQQNKNPGVANGFRISPVRSELTIEKGKSQVITISIDNPTDVATVAKPIVNDFVASADESGEPRLILDDNAALPKNDFKKLVGNIADIELGPKAKKDIEVTITVPADANSGGYYGAVRFAPGVAGQTANVGLTASVGTIVLVRVPGNLTERLDLVQLAASTVNGKAKSFYTSGNVYSLIRLKNSGDIHVQPFGKVLVKNMFGHIVYQYELNNTDPRSNILPDSIRRFDDQIKAKNLFGRYTIEANLGYSQTNNGNLISAKATFWYIPTWATISFLVLLVVIAAAVYWALKRRDNKLHHKSKTPKE